MNTTVAKVGLALDGTSACCVWLENGLWHSETIACDASASALKDAFEVLLQHASGSAEVTVTLCRPLLQSRTIAMPGVSKENVERILARDWSRHIVPARAVPHTVAATAVKMGLWYAQFAPADTLECIADEGNGQSLSGPVQSVDDALKAEILSQGNDERAGTVCGIVCDSGRPVAGVLIKNKNVVAGRGFIRHANADDAFQLANTASQNALPEIVICGDSTTASALSAELGAKGLRVRVIGEPPARRAPNGTHFSLLAWIAQAGLRASPGIALLAPSLQARRRARMRVLGWQLTGGVIAAALLGVALLRLDVQRQLAVVATQRAGLAASVQQAMRVRTQLEDVADAARSLAAHEATASRTSTIVAQIARTLPRTSALQSLTVMGDSVTIEGESPRSADVYSALRQVSVLDRLRLASPLRQERRGADTVVERFAFNAMVRGATSGRLASK